LFCWLTVVRLATLQPKSKAKLEVTRNNRTN
jgi:hypothetical protein